MPRTIRIAGGGPAGCAAAIAAAREGAEVELFEKARFPHHKVCGEFLSGEAAPILYALGISLDPLKPRRIERAELAVGSVTRTIRLDEPAFGISRYALDAYLQSLVPTVRREAAPDVDIVATGRMPAWPAARLYGFKAHYSGPASDSIGLYVFGEGYVGVVSVEGGMTNVCGIAPQDVLRRYHGEFDDLVNSYAPLAERLAPLTRAWKWMGTGPLEFGEHPGGYRCGDALAFIDPFTGAGMLHALHTGRLAGIAAARGEPAGTYSAQCRAWRRPLAAAAAVRAVLLRHWGALARVAPFGTLYRMTRIHA